MPFYEMLPGGMPAGLQSDMDAVLNKKWGTSTTYPPEDWPETVNLMGPLPERTVSGSVVAFADGADTVPLKKCEVTIPANLAGVSSVGVVHNGGNIFSSEWEQGSINTSGNNQINSNVIRTAGFMRVFEGVRYSFTRDITTDIINFRGYDAEQNYIGSGSTILNLISGYSVTNPMRAGDSTCTIEIKAGSGVSYIRMNDYSNDLSVKYTMCVGDTPLAQYSAYVSTTHTAQLKRTVYGGTADVVKGTGTETAGKAVFTGSETWQLYSNETFWYTTLAAGNIKVQQNCTTSNGVVVRYQSTNGQLRVYLSANVGVVDTQTDMNALLSNGVSFAYPYETPEAFTFDPVPIDSRYGDNTIWSDNGDIEVTYRRDIALALAQ